MRFVLVFLMLALLCSCSPTVEEKKPQETEETSMEAQSSMITMALMTRGLILSDVTIEDDDVTVTVLLLKGDGSIFNGKAERSTPTGLVWTMEGKVDEVFGDNGIPENEEDRKMLASVWLLSNISETDEEKE